MATLDLTAATGAPIFLKRSSINDDSKTYGTWSASTMQSLLDRIVDGDPESYWHQAVAGVTETLEFTSQLRTAKISRPVDFIALQNINWKRFTVEWKSGAGSYAVLPELDFSGSDNADTDIIVNPSTFNADSFRISITDVITPGEKVQLGGFYSCESQVQLARGLLSNPRQDDQAVRDHIMGDKSFFQDQVLHSAKSYTHYAANTTLQLVTQAELDTLSGIHRDGLDFVFVPHPGLIDRDIFTVRFRRPPQRKFESVYTGLGYRVNLNVREIPRL